MTQKEMIARADETKRFVDEVFKMSGGTGVYFPGSGPHSDVLRSLRELLDALATPPADIHPEPPATREELGNLANMADTIFPLAPALGVFILNSEGKPFPSSIYRKCLGDLSKLPANRHSTGYLEFMIGSEWHRTTGDASRRVDPFPPPVNLDLERWKAAGRAFEQGRSEVETERKIARLKSLTQSNEYAFGQAAVIYESNYRDKNLKSEPRGEQA